jgi:hypothetical protein
MAKSWGCNNEKQMKKGRMMITVHDSDEKDAVIFRQVLTNVFTMVSTGNT